MKLIINADDYGLDENRTRAIQESFRRGLITQTTLMVNMPWADRAVEEAKKLGISGKIGLHLNYTEGRPLTDEMRKCPIFCTPDGCYTGKWHVSKFRRFVMPAGARQAIAVEARAQMEKFLAYGLPLLHLDSHHHSHTDYVIAKVALPIAKELGFRTVRLSRNLGGPIGGLKKAYKNWFNDYVKRLGFKCTDFFSGFAPREVLRLADSSVAIEMMSHPFYFHGKTADMEGELGDSCAPIQRLADFLGEICGKVESCNYELL